MADTAAGSAARLDTTIAHSARLWSYLLGGKDHFAADRAAADKLLTFFPEIKDSVRECRSFLGRAVRFLVQDAGLRQFLDLGTGLPTVNNTHEVAQTIAPESRIVYVDKDPMALAHARALLTSSPQGSADYLLADVRDTAKIAATAQQTLDLDQPVGVIMLGLLNFITDDEQARRVVCDLVDAVPSGSYVVIAHPTFEVRAEALKRSIDRWNSSGCEPICARSPEELRVFFDGLELVEPGLVSCSQWRPANAASPTVVDFAGVARKP